MGSQLVLTAPGLGSSLSLNCTQLLARYQRATAGKSEAQVQRGNAHLCSFPEGPLSEAEFLVTITTQHRWEGVGGAGFRMRKSNWDRASSLCLEPRSWERNTGEE